uniref:Candidate secreted effector n=1 Tax=Meloidogyne incognita TaxID=6306 RepID=A0A914L277_MELIC
MIAGASCDIVTASFKSIPGMYCMLSSQLTVENGFVISGTRLSTQLSQDPSEHCSFSSYIGEWNLSGSVKEPPKASTSICSAPTRGGCNSSTRALVI